MYLHAWINPYEYQRCTILHCVSSVASVFSEFCHDTQLTTMPLIYMGRYEQLSIVNTRVHVSTLALCNSSIPVLHLMETL